MQEQLSRNEVTKQSSLVMRLLRYARNDARYELIRISSREITLVNKS